MNKPIALKFVLTLLFLTAVVSRNGYAQNLIPLPNKIEKQNGNFIITPSTVIVSHEYAALAQYLNEHIRNAAGFKLPVSRHGHPENRISLRKNDDLPREGYTLEITPHGIEIEGHDRGALFYGLQTLFQLMPPTVYDSGNTDFHATFPFSLPCIRIEDAPRFPYRGAMLDVSRNFSDKATVLKYIDWMSRHKLNKLHWHLSDDDGWRIEIKKYPELTAKGAWRGPGEALPPSYGSGEKRYGGFYTQDDIREIVKYAAFRNVEIIPEIDLPGHSRAIIATYPEIFCLSSLIDTEAKEEMHNVWCVGREENFDMLYDIFQEIAELFPSKYIHIGGDEVRMSYWKTCSRCKELMKNKRMKSTQELQSYFINRLENIVHSLGKECGAWNDALKVGKLREKTIIYGWEDIKASEEAVRKGQPVVMVPGSYCYIDMKQHPLDRGHTWAGLVDTRRVYSFDPSLAKLTEEEAGLVRGVEVALFSELLDRPQRFIEYQGYPRICALAEVGWTDKEQRDWNEFYQRLTAQHLDRLTHMGIQFRMFTPDVTYKNGKITAVAPVPGAEIRYTTDCSEPTANSPLYEHPLNDRYPERYKFRAFYGTGFSTPVPPASGDTVQLAPKAKRTVTVALKDYIDKDGVWYLNVWPYEDNTMINRLEVTGPDTTYLIIRNGQKANPFGNLRIYADERSRNADLIMTLTNESEQPNTVTYSLRPSPYAEPAVTVSSSLSFRSNFPAANLTDYNMLSYGRTSSPCKKGDYLLYTFTDPTDCAAIEVNTGIPNVTRYIVTQGRVEYSDDGKTFRKAGQLDDSGNLTFFPETPVKAIRIVMDASNGEPIVAFQDLKIRPKLQP